MKVNRKIFPILSLTGLVIMAACTGGFTSVPQLTTGTSYYVRAYAINSFGTAYGQNVYVYIPKN